MEFPLSLTFFNVKFYFPWLLLVMMMPPVMVMAAVMPGPQANRPRPVCLTALSKPDGVSD
jgi:hypothetical protein